MIDWVKAEYWPKLRLILTDGSVLTGSGNGIELAEDLEEEDSKDTFFIGTNRGSIAIPIDDIRELVFLNN